MRDFRQPDATTVAGATGLRRRRMRREFLVAALGFLAFLPAVVYGLARNASLAPAKAPEADRILRAQAGLPFQVLIPGYLPSGFDRARSEVVATVAGAGVRPTARIRYLDPQSGAAIFVSEWMPISPTLETLVGSLPIDTKWGRGYMLADPDGGLATVWADIGAVRVAVDSSSSNAAPPELLLGIVNSMGPAANRMVSSVIGEKPVIHAAAPPPPVPARITERGTQELTLVATPAGYSPARFSVRLGIPVVLTFRELEGAACAGELLFPANPPALTEVTLTSPQDMKTVQFTPAEAGDFAFRCSHDIFRGVMSVQR